MAVFNFCVKFNCLNKYKPLDPKIGKGDYKC